MHATKEDVKRAMLQCMHTYGCEFTLIKECAELFDAKEPPIHVLPLFRNEHGKNQNY